MTCPVCADCITLLEHECETTMNDTLSGVRFVDPALALDVVLPCHEAADVLLREYGEGPMTLPCIHTAAASLAAGHITAAHAEVAPLGIHLWEER